MKKAPGKFVGGFFCGFFGGINEKTIERDDGITG